jgi:uncharacterized membrane protein
MFVEILRRGYLLVLALWVGGMAAVTFAVTPSVFKAFPRDRAAEVVDAIFTVYFPALPALAAAALVLLLLSGIRGSRKAVSVALLAVAVMAGGYLNFNLVPRIAEVKKTVTSFEGEATTPERREFGKLHEFSMNVNLGLLVDGVVLLLLIPLPKAQKKEG